MEKHIEKEYKVLLEKEAFYKLLAFYPNIAFKTQTNYYYDTQALAIKALHGAMRIRETENQFIFTLKKFENGDLLEYEGEVKENSLAIFDEPQIQKILNQYHIEGPFQLLTALQTKRAMFIGDGYELCFDINEYNGKTDYEIEYEYTKEHDGLPIFQAILSQINITYSKNSVSKIERAMNSNT